MGLLDDLRNQADSQRASEEDGAKKAANRELFYKEKIQPRMVKTYQFFKELADHLNYIKMETIADYPLLPGGAPLSLRQEGYKVVIDSSKALKRIDFSMEAVLTEPVEFEIFGKDAVLNHSERIKNYSFRHDYKDKKDADQYVQAAKFVLKGPLPLKVTIEVLVDSSEIRVSVRNFVEPGFTKHVMSVEEFSDEFLDRVGKYVIRKEATLFGSTEELSDEARKQIRDRMIVEARMRQLEMLEAEAKRKAEEVVKKEQSTKEQLKRAVNTKVAKGKESLKDMFGKLKKQAGFDSTTTDTTLPPASFPTNQPAPVQPAAAAPKPKQPAPVQPAAAAPKPEHPSPVQPVATASKSEKPAPVQPSTAAPKPKQPAPVQPAAAAPKPEHPSPVQPSTAAQKPEPPVPVEPAIAAPKPKPKPKPKPEPPAQPATAELKPQAPVTQVPAHSEQNKQEPAARVSKKTQSPKVYEAPPGNPFLTPDAPEPSSEQENDLDSKLNQQEAKAEEESASGLEDEKTSSNLLLTSEELENDLVNIMQRETQANTEVNFVQDSVEKVEQEVTTSPESKLELALEDEPNRESESETKDEQQPDPEPELTIAPQPEAESDLNLKLEPEQEPELVLDDEPNRESESETKDEQQPDPEPELTIAPQPEAESNPKLELALEPSKESPPANSFLDSDGPDIDLSPPSPSQEEIDADVPLRTLFPSSNKKPKE